jgi:hypothetical protein
MFKLLNQDMTSHNNTKWVIGEKKKTNGKGELCSPGWLHCYEDKLLAVLLNPIHADIKNPRMFVCGVSGKRKLDGQLKRGYTIMWIKNEIELPVITLTQKIAFAILCALEVCKDSRFIKWANNCLNGKDRSYVAAADAAYAASAAASTYANAAVNAAANAAVNAAADADINFVKLAKEAMPY